MPALSAAWVMMAYEVIRTLCQKHRAHNPDFAKSVEHPLNLALQVFSRIRMPLAKHEAGRKSRDTWPHAVLGFQEGVGTGWAISPNEFRTRAQLADILIDCLTLALPPDQRKWELHD